MRVLAVSLMVVIVDQISKFAVRYSLEYGRSQELFGDMVRLTYVKNPGMAFGIQLGDHRFFTIFASIATIVILIFIVRARAEKLSLRFALALILGGAAGNLIDRIWHRGVIDFIDVGIGSMRWPIFNLADCAVTIGMAALLCMVLLDRNESREFERSENRQVGETKTHTAKRNPLV